MDRCLCGSGADRERPKIVHQVAHCKAESRIMLTWCGFCRQLRDQRFLQELRESGNMPNRRADSGDGIGKHLQFLVNKGKSAFVFLNSPVRSFTLISNSSRDRRRASSACLCSVILLFVSRIALGLPCWVPLQRPAACHYHRAFRRALRG